MTRAFAGFGWLAGVTAALAVLLAYGWAEGVWTGRWRPSDASKKAAARLKEIPLTIGAWDGADGEFDERQLAIGELDGYLHRIYTDRATGQQVQVLLVCGRPGPVSVHTPDVCYRGLGYSTISSPKRKVLATDDSGNDATCWMADFQKPSLGGKEYLRIAWTWFADGTWHAADQPRFEFALQPALFKAYLIHPVSEADAVWESDATVRFAKELLPVLTAYLADRADRADESPAPSSEALSPDDPS